MVRKVHASVLAAALIAGLAPAAFAQTGMIKGKVVDAEDKPIQGAVITIEFTDGVNRKFEVKSDRRGEFIQIGLAPGGYKVTATAEKIETQGARLNAKVAALDTGCVDFAKDRGHRRDGKASLDLAVAQVVIAFHRVDDIAKDALWQGGPDL